MHCESVKPGVDCTFMTKKGCSFNGGKCKTVCGSLTGCDRTLGAMGIKLLRLFSGSRRQMAPGFL